MQQFLEACQRGNQFGRQLLPGEIPDHRTQLVLCVEAKTMVDQVKLAGTLLEQDVPPLRSALFTSK